MRARRVFHAVDSHTEGMPTRVITGGVGPIPGTTMLERRDWFVAHQDELRTLLMYEPRGHASMSGAILQPPTRPDADWGVLYIEVSGCLPMCGHGTIGVATVLVETGMVEVTEPITTIRLDTPAGLVVADVAVEDGAATAVTFRNVASYSHTLDAHVSVPGLGDVRYDLAYGGNFYPLVPVATVGLDVHPGEADALIRSGLAIMAAINAQAPPAHPDDSRIAGCAHVVFTAPGRDGADGRAATAIHPGWLDRSPCGTGTSARLAQLHARGELAVGDTFVHESILGTRFTGRVAEETTVAGRPAIVPEISGRAWITGTAQYLLDPDDPFPAGFAL